MMMERKFARNFMSLVRELIPSDEDKENLFEALRHYQSSQNLSHLLEDLRYLLDEPNKLELYEFMRPLILMRHQIEYSKQVPYAPGTKLRVIRLQRHSGESLGFAVRGGYEHGVGLFVTTVTPGSQADRQGLRVGDEIVRVNGFTIAEAIHDDILNLIRSREDIILKVTHIGMIPVKEEATDSVTWKYVEPLENLDNENGEIESGRFNTPQDIKIFIDSTGHASIGCSILSECGPTARYPGIFVEKVKQGSLGHEVGLEPGDQIVEVNETSFKNITWKEAVLALKSSRQLNMVIRKKVGTRFLQTLSSNSSNTRSPSSPSHNIPNDPSSSTGLDQRDASDPVSSTHGRVTRTWGEDDVLDQAHMIQQQLNMKAFAQRPSMNSPPSPQSTASAASSVISTSAEVHISPSYSTSDRPTQREITSVSVSSNASSQLSSSAPLDGAAAVKAERHLARSKGGNVPTLLAAQGDFEWTETVPWKIYQQFDSNVLDGRPLNCITYKKSTDLGVGVEGGVGSPLAGKIMVGMVFEGGVAHQSGKMRVGDQLMMVNGIQMVGISLSEAERILADAGNTSKDMVEVFYCESLLINDEDSVTYF